MDHKELLLNATNYQTDLAPSTGPATQGDCASPILLVGLFLWVGVLAGARTLSVIGMSIAPVAHNELLGALITAGQAALTGLAIVPAAIWWRRPRYQAIFRMWALADLLVLLFAPVQILGYHAGQGKALVQGVVALIIALILWRRLKNQPSVASSNGHGNLPLAVFLGGLAAIPFALWGALGSPLDTLLALFQGFALGLVIGVLLEGYALRKLAVVERLLAFAAGFAMVVPDTMSDKIGLGLIALLAGIQLWGRHRRNVRAGVNAAGQ